MSDRKLSNFCLPHHIWGNMLDPGSCAPLMSVEGAIKGIKSIHKEARENLDACAVLSVKSAQKIEEVLLRVDKMEELLDSIKDETTT